MALFGLTVVSLILLHSVSSFEVEFEAEYFSNITLTCDDKLLGLPYTTFKKYWILPNGSTIQWSRVSGNRSRYFLGESPGFNLTITHIDEADFGWYYCVILWDNYIYLVHSMKIGLNVNGALYKDLLDQYRKSAIIGLIAGGVMAAVLGLFCMLYWCRYSEVNTENVEKKSKQKKSKTKIQSVKTAVDSSDKTCNSKSNTVSTQENEAIYELDKAVKDYEGDDATVIGDGEIAIGIKKVTDGAEDDGMPVTIFEHVSATTEITRPDVPKCSDDDGDCDNVVIPLPPPLPPLLHTLNDSFEGSDDTTTDNNSHELVFFNHAFGAGNNPSHEDALCDPDKKYVFEDDTKSSPTGHYAEVKF